jgi:hypothetical protein
MFVMRSLWHASWQRRLWAIHTTALDFKGTATQLRSCSGVCCCLLQGAPTRLSALPYDTRQTFSIASDTVGAYVDKALTNAQQLSGFQPLGHRVSAAWMLAHRRACHPTAMCFRSCYKIRHML